MPDAPDFAAMGLLDGLEGDERRARLNLLERLHAEGCSLDDLEEAAREGRLSVVPLERLMRRRTRYSLADTAERTGLPLDYLHRNHRSLGLPRPADDEPVYDDEQVENIQTLAAMTAAGVPEEDVHDLTRILGDATRRTAEALLDRLTKVLAQPGDTEWDIALRYVDFAEALLPRVDQMIGAPLKLHLLDVVQREALGRVEHESGRLAGAREVGVAFVDLAGFTAFSEKAAIEEVGSVAERFESLASRAAEPPVRLVKLLGDGAMLVCDDAGALLAAVLDMRDGTEGAGLPPLHAGMTFGPALRSLGDWYGRTVNLAARLCDAAGRGTVLVTPEVGARVNGAFACTPAGTRRLKGVDEPVAVLEVRRAHSSTSRRS